MRRARSSVRVTTELGEVGRPSTPARTVETAFVLFTESAKGDACPPNAVVGEPTSSNTVVRIPVAASSPVAAIGDSSTLRQEHGSSGMSHCAGSLPLHQGIGLFELFAGSQPYRL